MSAARRLVISQREFDLISQSLAATVERFDMLRQMPGLEADVRKNLIDAREEYSAALHALVAGQRDADQQPRLVG